MHKRLPYILLAVGSMVYFAGFLRLLPANTDEGTLVLGAARVAEGQVPYRDFFEVMGPGTFYWLAAFFKLLGPTWLATRICLMVTTVTITVLLYWLANRLLRAGGVKPPRNVTAWPALGPVVFFVAVSFHSWNAISHHMDSNLFGLLAFFGLLQWIDKRQAYWLFLAGASAALTAWFMLPKGVFLGLSFVVLLWILDRKECRFRVALGTLCGGFAAIMIAGAAFFWFAGGFRDLIYTNLIWPLTNYSGANAVPYGLEFRELYWKAFATSFRALFPSPLAISITSFLSAPFLVLMSLPAILLAFCVRFRAQAFDRATLPYWVAGAAFWLSEMHRKDIAHIAFGSPLLIILTFHYASRLEGKWPDYVRQSITAAAVSLALLNPLVALAASHKTVTPRGVLYSSHPQNPVLDFLNARVAPGQPVFIYPYAPIYYFLSAAKNPTRYSILMNGYNNEAQLREVVECLEANPVRYVIWDRSFPVWVKTWFPSYRVPPPDRQIIEPYLSEHYKVIGGMESGYQFLERKEPITSSLAAPVRDLGLTTPRAGFADERSDASGIAPPERKP
jgi:hypothetical protein